MVKEHSQQEKYLVFLGSSTPEKLRDYQHICEQKRLPIYFRDIRELLAAFKSSQEKTGKYRGNLLDKLQKVQGSIIEMLPNSEEVVSAKCAEYGIEYDPSKVFFATEDGGLSLPAPIWKAVDKEGIPKEILENIEKKSADCGPDVEMAPVMSAVLGSQNLMERVVKAARSLGFGPKSQVPLTEKVFLSLTPFKGESSRPEVIARGETVNYLYDYTNNTAGNGRISTYHYARPKDVLDKSCAELGADYVTKYSARAKTIEDLAGIFGIGAAERKAEPLAVSPPSPFMLGILPEHAPQQQSAHVHQFLKKNNGTGSKFAVRYPERVHWVEDGSKTPDDLNKYYSQMTLGGIEDIVKSSDGFLLLPDAVADPGNDRKFEKFHTLFSLIVAKQLVARDMHKPVVILNHDGSWDEAIANHVALVNHGMSKDYNIAWPERPEGISKATSIESNGYFDVIRATNYDDSLAAALNLLNRKRDRYQRRPQPDDIEFEGGIAPDAKSGWDHGKTVDDLYKVAVFCSATNENVRLNENIEKLSYQLARQNFGVIYGGGDQHTMGAVLQGVVRRRKELTALGMSDEDARMAAYVAGYSTAPILISETEKGQFSPDLSYYKQTRNIYDRMAEMIRHSDTLVIAPGGAGTLQEWVAPLLMKKSLPELCEHKSIVIYNPDLFDRQHSTAGNPQKVWDTALKSVLGADYELLTSKPTTPEQREARDKRSHELGVYVETDLSDVQKRLNSLRRQHESREKQELKWAAAERRKSLKPGGQDVSGHARM